MRFVTAIAPEYRTEAEKYAFGGRDNDIGFYSRRLMIPYEQAFMMPVIGPLLP